MTLFSRERGKLSAFARGARSSRRRFGGALEPFTLLAAELDRARRRPAGAWRTRRWSGPSAPCAATWPASPAPATPSSWPGSWCATPSRTRTSSTCWSPTWRCSTTAPARPWDLRRFELDALRAAGLQPALDGCARCGRPAGDGAGPLRPGARAACSAPACASTRRRRRASDLGRGARRRCAGCSGGEAGRRPAALRGRRRRARILGRLRRDPPRQAAPVAPLPRRGGADAVASAANRFRLTAPAAGTYEGGPGSGRERESEGSA